MPVQQGRDQNGSYFQWGYHGKKYYYDPRDEVSRREAHESAVRQAYAAYAKGWQSPRGYKSPRGYRRIYYR